MTLRGCLPFCIATLEDKDNNAMIKRFLTVEERRVLVSCAMLVSVDILVIIAVLSLWL